jgi:hypothetical protein
VSERIVGIAAIVLGVVAVVIAVINPGYDVLAIVLGAALASWGSYRLLTA